MKSTAPGSPVMFKGILLAQTRLGYVIGNVADTQEYYFSKSDIRSIWYNKDVEDGIEVEIPLHIARSKGVII